MDHKIIFDMSMMGIMTGFISGFIGAGTGVILVPFLLWYFHQVLDYNLALSLTITTSTSIAVMAITSFFNYYFRRNHGNISKHLIVKLIIIITLSAFIGTILKKYIFVALYKAILIYLLLYFGVQTIRYKEKITDKLIKSSVFDAFFYVKCTFLYTLSVVSGTGTGQMFISLFRSYGMEKESAILLIKPLAIYSCVIISLIDMIVNWHAAPIEHCVGTIYMPAFIVISIISIFPMYLGVVIGNKCKMRLFDYIFAIFMLVSAILIFVVD